jgi:hypothetical protein
VKSANGAAIGTPAAFRCRSETPPALSRRITIVSGGRRQKLEPSRATRLTRPGTLITAHGACAEMLSLSRPTANDNRSIISLRRANPPAANSIAWKKHPGGSDRRCRTCSRLCKLSSCPVARTDAAGFAVTEEGGCSQGGTFDRRLSPAGYSSWRRPPGFCGPSSNRAQAGWTAVCGPAAHARADLLPRAAAETSPAEWRSDEAGEAEALRRLSP